MQTQKFKGDATELKVEAAFQPATDLISASLDQFFAGGYDSNVFLLNLYDAGRIPFKDRVPRDSFLAFYRQALKQFPFTGTFETYVFIIKAIFGDGSSVLFNIPAPGKLEMLVNAASNLPFDAIFTEFNGSTFSNSNFVDKDGNQVIFTGVSGINSQSSLLQLLAEIFPAGIYPALTLAFYSIYNWIDNTGAGMIDNAGNDIIFFQSGS